MYLRQYISLFHLVFWSFAAYGSEAIETKHPNYEPAATPVSGAFIGERADYETWTAATVEAEGRRMCLVASAIVVGHSLALLSVSIRPTEHVIGQLGVRFDFEADERAHGKAEVGGQTFDLTGKGRNTWVSQLSDQQRLIETLRKGDVLTITMPKLSGAVNVFAYPLAGFNDAWNFAEARCSVGLS